MKKNTLSGLSEEQFILAALAEDLGDGDHTSLSTIDEDKTGKANIKVKEDGVISGLAVAKNIFRLVDENLKTDVFSTDGNYVKNGDIVMTVSGNVRSLLKAERLVLNCMQRMSGISSLTRKFVTAIDGTRAKILDTRKTTPNFRHFEKAAVLAGGALNHRFGLFDMILIKDNHVDAAGGIKQALEKANNYLKKNKRSLSIEIETRNLEEVKQVLETGFANRIMLDNFNTEKLREAVDLINDRMETEASGGINLQNIRNYAQTGVQFISVGALTHSYTSLDISMKLTE